MKNSDAIEMIRDAVGVRAGVWADLGAGTGTFTRALTAVLGAGSTVYAVDGDARAERALRELSSSASGKVRVIAVHADFTRPLELPGLARADAQLDGILLANALHFVRDAEGVLSNLVKRLRPGGRVVVVEYDRRAASQWVPYPIPPSRWRQLADPDVAEQHRIDPVLNPKAESTATRPSSYSGILYTGVATRPRLSEQRP